MVVCTSDTRWPDFGVEYKTVSDVLCTGAKPDGCRPCQSHVMCKCPSGVTHWSEWSHCTSTCDKGSKTRYRNKVDENDQECSTLNDTTDCIVQPCISHCTFLGNIPNMPIEGSATNATEGAVIVLAHLLAEIKAAFALETNMPADRFELTLAPNQARFSAFKAVFGIVGEAGGADRLCQRMI